MRGSIFALACFVATAAPAAADTLTFARIHSGDGYRLIAVTEQREAEIEGVDLTGVYGTTLTDPIEAYRSYGHDALLRVVASAPRITLPRPELTIPLDLGSHHIAVGTNYPEHADESGVERGPFLFPKLVEPTGPRAVVPAGAALLDYEVELCFVALDSVNENDTSAAFGLLLCNDFTDRAALLRNIDVDEPESGKGFTTGKSFDGYMPVGEFFVIPRDARSFARAVELTLSVNGVVRQRAVFETAVWDLDRILAETFARKDTYWAHGRGTVSLLAGASGIAPRTVILSGTPHGTVFQGVPLTARLRGVAAWAMGGWGTPLVTHVIEAYIRTAAEAGLYLQPGDKVVATGTGLGSTRNEIVAQR